MAIQTLYPTIKPSLNLDFANTKALDPRITFTRTTTARYYDGKTVAKAEENLLLYSQEFDSGFWTKSSLTATANTTVSPDGTTTAETITTTASTARHDLSQSAQATINSAVYTVSIFAKAGTNNFIQLFVFSQSSDFANFDLSNGTVGTTGGSVTATISSVGNNWYRCSLTYTAGGVDRHPACLLASSSSAARGESWATLGTETVFLWGAQLEQRDAVTAYTPTTTQAITNYIPVLQTAAAGQARFDYNPVTGESLGLLIEEQRTNLSLQSETFSDAYWAKNNSSISLNTIVSPDGTLTGDKLVEASNLSGHNVGGSSISITSGTVYSISVFAKAAERNILQLTLGASASHGYVNFNLTTGTIDSSGNSPASSSITSIGNGWYRCVANITALVTSSTSLIAISISFSGATRSPSYQGDGYSGIYIWGAQLEVGAFPTSYIPTVAATVTRNADAASMTGTNFSSWYRADEGTLYADTVFNSAPVVGLQDRIPMSLFTSGTKNMRLRWRQTSLDGRFTVTDNNTTQADLIFSSITSGASVKLSGAYKFNDFSGSMNGSAVVADTSGTVPAINQLNLGSFDTTTDFLNGTIKKLAYYPSRLTNAQLQALTV